MTQEEIILYEIERRGGRITTFELMSLHISQYQRAMKVLRGRLAQKGWVLTEAQKIENQPRNNMYCLIKPGGQLSLFQEEHTQVGVLVKDSI